MSARWSNSNSKNRYKSEWTRSEGVLNAYSVITLSVIVADDLKIRRSNFVYNK